MTICLGVSAKSAILLTHYGSSDDETRAKTISLITDEVSHSFPEFEVREAYISPVVRRTLAIRGIPTDSPVNALLRLRTEGYDTVYVQSTTLIDGTEMGEVRSSVEQTASFFKKIALGRPLLFTPDDCREVAEVLLQEPCGKNEAVVYVGHGNMLPSTATYSQLDNMLGVAGKTDCVYHVSTIEGYPSSRSTVSQLAKDKKIKDVKLVPLLLVCGNHTKRDIAGEYSDIIREAGYNTTVVMRGLGENPSIRAIYISRIIELVND